MKLVNILLEKSKQMLFSACLPGESQIFIFSYLCMVVIVLFWGQIFELEILMDLHVFMQPESPDVGF